MPSVPDSQIEPALASDVSIATTTKAAIVTASHQDLLKYSCLLRSTMLVRVLISMYLVGRRVVQ